MVFAEGAVQRFLAGRRVMALGTVGPTGAPLVTPVWFAHTTEALYLYSMATSRKVRNIGANPRVSVAVETGQRASEICFLIIRGTAAVVRDAPEVEQATQALLERYGTDLRERWGADRLPPDRSMIRITPHALFGRGVA